MIRRIVTRVLLAAALVIGFTMIAGAPASAAELDRVTAAAAVIAFTLPPTLIVGLLVSTVLPLLVGLVTKTVTNSGTKAILLAALAAATGLLSELGAAWTSERVYDLGTGLLTALTAFLVAVGLHFGIYKPTGVAEKLQQIGSPPQR